MKKKKMSPRVGQWCRVWFNDVGARDGLVVGREGKSFRFLEPFETESNSVSDSQVIAIGRRFTAEHSGLVENAMLS